MVTVRYAAIDSAQHTTISHGHRGSSDTVLTERKSSAEDITGVLRQEARQDTPKRNYKPVALRTGSLAVLIVLTTALIGLLQLALIRLPTQQGKVSIGVSRNDTSLFEDETHHRTDRLFKRQISALQKRSYIPSTDPVSASPSEQSDFPTPNYINAASYIQLTQTVSGFGSSTDVPTSRTTDIPSLSTSSNAYVQVSATDVASAMSSSSACVPPIQTSDRVTVQAANPSGYVAPKSTSTVTAGSPGLCESNTAPRETEIVVVKWGATEVFLGTYLSVLLAVVYRIIISIVKTQLYLIIPFRQLATSRGAFGATAFFEAYQSKAALDPLVALVKGHLLRSIIGIALWLSCLLPALASEAIWVDTRWECPHPGVGPNSCPPRTTASVVIVRLMQCLLGFLAVILIGLAYALRTMTGLEHDPSSIAAVAALMGHPGLDSDLTELQSCANLDAMKLRLAEKRYKLSQWCSQSGEHHYGVVPVRARDDDQITISDSDSSAVGGGKYEPLHKLPHFCNDGTPRWRWTDLLLLFLVSGVFGIALAYFLTHGDNDFNKYFNSDTFGPRFILTGAATAIVQIWSNVEERAMIMAPFVHLARKSASFDALSFAPTVTPILSTWRAMSHGYIFATMVTTITLLGEVLSVVISSMPFSTGQTFRQFLIVSYTSLTILGLMIPAAVAVMIHRWHEPNLSYVPDTLGVKMAYLAGSRMLAAFDRSAVEYRENRPREKRYSFASVMGKDGVRIWKVDEINLVQERD